MKFGLKADDIQLIHKVFSKHKELQSAVIFGSRAKETHSPGSDIDLVFYGKQLDLTIRNAIAHELDELLLPYQFDLLLWNQLDHEELKDHIRRVGKEFYVQELE